MHIGGYWFLIPMALGFGIAIGCADGRGSLVPAEGKVTLNGKPLANATIAFSPTNAIGPGPFVGTTDAEGEFSLGPIGNERGGAEVGQYILVITTVKSDPNAMEGSEPTQKEIVPMAFRDGSTRYTVPAGGTTEANFDMNSR